ncbi:BglG family transcription antiterminator [Bacillus taeanensis]|uniref:Uncharacterized protein n=1 Tax=Bacillus taeanensis TaxID=273032 RepID=A0A366XYL4_9BACI|nr:BglG family transcription antiterminator [Bacillus taeanensis]RBW69254.1 hypothetical protein DS031_12815 [Bacillus taeanensis]
MTQQHPLIDSRQKELLRTLLYAKGPVSYKELADKFKLSTRTIQREITSLKSVLQHYDLKVGKKIGQGIELKGGSEGRELLEKQLQESKTMSAYSPEERQEGITYDLLLSKEPVKHFVFSKKYGVTESTISNDLDKAEGWLNKGRIILVRLPGVGVYVEGTEQQRRTMLSRLMHKDITFEEWMELFHSPTEEGENKSYHQLEAVIRNRLLKFVHTPNILVVEKAVREVIDAHKKIELTDRNYVNLIVHLMLAVERIKHGEIIEEQPAYPVNQLDEEAYFLAEKIVTNLEKGLSIAIPKTEVNYIALHLAGARMMKQQNEIADNEAFQWIELAQSFIRAAEYYLEESLQSDAFLLDGLVSHFVPAFNRLKLGLQIHNPMLEKIKEKYPDTYHACEKACTLLSEKTGYIIPEEEIGYLAMHIGASLIRKKDMIKKNYQAVVICASGLGTSTYLASKIRTEMPNLHVKDVISVNELQGLIKDDTEIDIFISTVNLPFLEGNEKVVTVSPFLVKEDLTKIQKILEFASKKEIFVKEDKKQLEKQSSMVSLAKYGEGMMQILRNIVIVENVEVKQPLLLNVLEQIKERLVICDFEKMHEDLEKREKQGGFVLENVAMLHAKTVGVKELFVSIFRMNDSVEWNRDDDAAQSINTFLLLAVPKDSPKEHIEMISEISAMLVEDEFLAVLTEGSREEVNATIDDVLSNLYRNKAVGSLKGL